MSNDFSQPQVLECPSCGASLPLPEADTFLCDYCGKRILVPPELRLKKSSQSTFIFDIETAEKIHQVQPQIGSEFTHAAPSSNETKQIFIISIGVFVLIFFGIVLFLLFFIPAARSPNTNESSIMVVDTTPLPSIEPFAKLAMVFGSQGDQPGQFDDARSIAVDDQGNIFVADYTTGRINKFDPQGNFLQLIQVRSVNDIPDVYIYSLATDPYGNLFVACDGNILQYDTASGKLLLTIPDQWPDTYFQSVVVAPDGNLYSTNGMAGADDVMIVDSNGQMLAHWMDTIEDVNHDDPSMELVLAVNHNGTVYILSPFGNKVYAYNPDGTFSFSFGGQGEQAGQFDLSTGMLAVTEQDYLVISDVYRVDLFNADGNYLNRTFTIDYSIAGGSMYGMTIDLNGNLYYISSGGKVLKFEMNYP